MDKALSSGISPTILDEYEGDKKNFDNYLEKGDEPKRKPKDVTTQQMRGNIDDTDGEVSLNGTEMFDIDEAVFDLPYTLEDIEGNESFLESIKKGAANLLRIIKNFFIWLKELLFNRTKKINNRLESLKFKIKVNGRSDLNPTKYPASVGRLMTTLKLSTPNGLWVVDSLKKVNDFFTDSLAGLKVIEGYAVEITGPFNREALKERIRDITEAYTRAIRATEKKDNSVGISLPGFKTIKVLHRPEARISDTRVITSVTSRPVVKDVALIPDMSIVDKAMVEIAKVQKDLNRIHQSQSSANRQFEKLVKSLMYGKVYEDQETATSAKLFYGWIIKFHQSAVTASLNYVYDAVNAGLDFCDANLRK